MLQFIKISFVAFGAINGQQVLSEEDADSYVRARHSRRQLGIFGKVGKWFDETFGKKAEENDEK